MAMLKRMTTSIWASVDRIVTQMENHEALVEASIEEIQRSSAKAKVSLARVRNDGQKMRDRIVELENTQKTWEERALSCAKTDEAKAVECIKRRNSANRQKEALLKQETEHKKVEKLLTDDLNAIEKKLQELRVKRNILKTRQSRAEALSMLHGDDSRMVSEIGSILDRWETRVMESEYSGSCCEKGDDALDREFVSAEEEADLKAELADLVSKY